MTIKSSKSVEYKITDYKGEETVLFGRKSLRRNIHGNWVCKIGKNNVEWFGSSWDAANWFLGDDCTAEEIQAFMKQNLMW